MGAVVVLLASTAGQLADALRGGHLVGLPLMLLFSAAAGYAVGTWANSIVATTAVVAAASALTAANQIADPGEYPVLDDLVFFLLVVGAPAAAAVAVRTRARQVRKLQRLHDVLALQRERAVQVARLEERNRIEVDLERSFCEQITAILLCAEGAQTAPAEKVGEALSDVENTARATLDQLRQALGTLNDSPKSATRQPEASTEFADLPPRAEAPPGWRDVLLAAICAVAMAIEGLASPETRGSAWANVILAAVAAAPLAWRRTSPVAVSVALFSTFVVMGQISTPPTTMVTTIAPLLVVSYAVGAHARQRQRLAGFAVVAAGLVAAVLASPTPADDAIGIPPPLIGCVLAGALGIVAAGWSTRAARTRQAVEAVASGRELEVQLAVAEERCALARDLHDSVAHAMTVVCLQAAAGGVAGDRSTLDTIVTTARRGLVELQAGLGGLGDSNNLDPSSLTTQARHAGLDSDVRVIGDPMSLSGSSLQLSARILREAIVNAGRYAPGSRLTVAINAHPPLVHLEIVDNGGAVPATWTEGAGTGLAGLATELTQAGGSLEWGPIPTGGFRVAAEVPA